jgi:hypothetical protein
LFSVKQKIKQMDEEADHGQRAAEFSARAAPEP